MSSLGDILHTLPALSDAHREKPSLHFHWLIEENFREIPAWNPAVKKIFSVGLRRWRKTLFKWTTWKEFKTLIELLRNEKYDLILDAQGLLKSAVFAKLAKGKRIIGFNRRCVRESLASFFYTDTFFSHPHQHAIKRLRALFAFALNYDLPASPPDYRVSNFLFPQPIFTLSKPLLIFLHGTTKVEKSYPIKNWKTLIHYANKENFHVVLLWGSKLEKKRAENLRQSTSVTVMPKLNLNEIASLFFNAQGIISVDTGLGHLAAALGVYTLSLYGPTDPHRIGTVGKNQFHLKAKAGKLKNLPAEKIWNQFKRSNPTQRIGSELIITSPIIW